MISDASKKLIKELAVKYDLKLVMLFGSASRDTEQKNSDIDIAILGNSNFYEKDYSKFLYDMAKIEDVEKREIEVVPISDRNPILLKNIFDGGIPLYIKNQTEYQKIRNWARFSYEDNAKFFHGREKMIKERLSKI